MNEAGLLDHATIEGPVEVSADKPLLLALSGGGDSTALLHLMAERVGVARLAAVIVDHGLRESSADEAQQAGAAAEAAGVPARVVRLDWPNGRSTAQQTT